MVRGRPALEDWIDEIAPLLAQGHAMREIAEILGISEPTVKTRIRTMRRLLGETVSPEFHSPKQRNNVQVGIAWIERSS